MLLPHSSFIEEVIMKACVTVSNSAQLNLAQLVQLKLEGMDYFQVLTSRERECLLLTCTGYASKEIADELCVSRRTAESHLLKIKQKFKVGTKYELIKLIFG